MVKKNEEEPVVSESICKCPNCGASLSLVKGEVEPAEISEHDFAKEDEDDQRDTMEKDFKKRMGKLEEYE